MLFVVWMYCLWALCYKVPWSALHFVMHFVVGKCNSDQGTWTRCFCVSIYTCWMYSCAFIFGITRIYQPSDELDLFLTGGGAVACTCTWLGADVRETATTSGWEHLNMTASNFEYKKIMHWTCLIIGVFTDVFLVLWVVCGEDSTIWYSGIISKINSLLLFASYSGMFRVVFPIAKCNSEHATLMLKWSL